jgi:hypothetical protein
MKLGNEEKAESCVDPEVVARGVEMAFGFVSLQTVSGVVIPGKLTRAPLHANTELSEAVAA